MNCPCQSGQSFDRCCGRFISQDALPENAEQLMRSRYSAYALGKLAYLKTTWHADYCPPDLALDPAIRWIGLEILAFEAGETAARVEFEARFLVHDRVDAVHECSSFVREQGKWMYTEGKMLPPGFTPWNPGRNENCPCGSGKKFKRCCAQH